MRNPASSSRTFFAIKSLSDRLRTAYRARAQNPARIRISNKDRILFTKRLALYLNSGIPIAQAMYLLCEDIHSRSHLFLMQTTTDHIQRGIPLSEALSLFPRSYRAFHTRLISVGEASGTLAETLTYLADILTRRALLVRKIAGALVYPCVIVLGTTAVSSFLVLYAFPKIVPLFRGLHAKLPLSTRMLIGISDAVQHHGWLLLIAILSMLGCCAYGLRYPQARQSLQHAAMRIPLVREMIRNYYLASIYRMLAVLLQSGMRIDAALALIEEAVFHSGYKTSLAQIYEGIVRGSSLSALMRQFPLLYPLVAVQLIAAGEMTGTLSQSARTIAELHEERLDETARAFSSLLEPLLMVAMGMVVGFVALAIITPMYGITQNLSIH